jgi:hypothetical protein
LCASGGDVGLRISHVAGAGWAERWLQVLVGLAIQFVDEIEQVDAGAGADVEDAAGDHV